MKLLRTSVIVILIFISLLIAGLDSYAQMRQVNVDNIQPANEIYKLSFYSPSEGYVAFRDWIGYTKDSGRTFIQKKITTSNVNYNGYSVNLTFGFDINGVKAFNKNTVIAYGDYGLVPSILYSSDGGNSFKLVFHSQFNPLQLSTGIKDIVFPQNDNIGFAIDADRILKTTDFGLTWSTINIAVGSFFDHLEAVDNINVFAMSTAYTTNKLIKTTNSGLNWRILNLPVITNGKMSYPYFLTANTGWLSMKDDNNVGYFYKTIDGGNNWLLQNSIPTTSFFSKKLKFVNDSTGYALSNQYIIYKTTNNGSIWEPLQRDNNFINLGYTHTDIQFLSATQFWAGGGHGFLEINTNAAQAPLPKAYFKIDTSGFASGNNINLLNYSNPVYQFKWYVNNILVSSNYNATYVHNILNSVDSIKLSVTSGTGSDSITEYQYFVVPNFPVINSFYPISGTTSTFITITGSGLSGVTSVKFGGVPASSFSIISPNVITATISNGASGLVSVTDSHGTSSQPGFTYNDLPVSDPPLINGFTPTSGAVGTNVTITGNNFGATTSSNVIYFGATKAAIISSSANQIVCKVPVGASYKPISILNVVTHLSTTSKKPFNVTFPDSSNFTPSSFSTAYELDVANFGAVTGVDMDGDNQPDLISVTGNLGSNLTINRNAGFGGIFSFDPAIKIADGGNFEISDLDGDGLPDIGSVTNKPFINIVRNKSTPGLISFDSQIPVSMFGDTQDLAIDDLDNDGKPDIAVAGYDGLLSIVKNTSVPGFLSFAEPKKNILNSLVLGVKIGDIDGDGNKDVVTLNSNLQFTSTSFTCFRSTSVKGNISFQSPVIFSVPGIAGAGRNIFLADYDNDNKLDVIILLDHNYSIFRNISIPGNIGFDTAVNISFTYNKQGGNIANLNGDSKPDAIIGAFTARMLSLYENTSVPGTISNDNGTTIVASPYMVVPYNTNAADFNMDGKMDLIVSGASDNKILILKNNIGIPSIFSLCANTNSNITSDLNGNNYQWQTDTGRGFTNLADNLNFSGTKTVTLNLTNIPAGWNGYKYRCNVEGKYSTIFKMVVTVPTKPIVSISTSTPVVCFGNEVLFTAVGTNAGANPIYDWMLNDSIIRGDGTQLRINLLRKNDKISVIIRNQDLCSIFPNDTSNVITMTITGNAPSVSITAPITSACSGSSLNFTATPANADSILSYQWTVDGNIVGTNSPLLTTSAFSPIVASSMVKVTLGSITSCGNYVNVSSNLIPVTVTYIPPPTISISSNNQATCKDSSVTFIATVINPGTSPSYQWQVNGINTGTNIATFSTNSLKDKDQIKAIITSYPSCGNITATSNVIVMSMSAVTPPTVVINTITTDICSETNTTFTATPSNADSTKNYQWQVNGVNEGTNSNIFNTASLKKDDQVKVILTSVNNCGSISATSNIITLNVIAPLQSSVTISTASINICPSTTVSFTAIPVNGGTSPSYQWQINGVTVGSNSNIFITDALQPNDQVLVKLTSNATCVLLNATSNLITMVIPLLTKPLPVKYGKIIKVTNPDATVKYSWQQQINSSWSDVIPSQNDVSFNVLVSGVYRVSALKNGCIVFSDSLSAIINSSSNRKVYLFPNPASQIIIIDSIPISQNWENVDIVNDEGKRMYLPVSIKNSTSITISVRSILAGTYFAILRKNTGETLTLKFVKK